MSFNALYASRYGSTFIPTASPLSACGSEYIYSNQYDGLSNTIRFTTVFQPYYKLVIYAKVLPIYKSVLPNTMGLIINARMSDNASNAFTASRELSAALLNSCQEEYITISSRMIKDQSVTIDLLHQLTSSNYNNTALQ